MSNTFLTPSIIAKESILQLEANMVMGGLVHRDFSKEFAKVGDTITVRKPATFTAAAHNGTSLDIQNATEGSVAVKLDTLLDVSFEVTSTELSLSIQDFSEQLLQPALRAHAQAIDALLCGLYVDIPYKAAASSTAVISDIAALNRILNLQKVPQSQRRLVLDPQTESEYIVLDGVIHKEKSGSSDALRDANLGRILTFDTYMDQNVVSHAKGDLDANATLTGSEGDLTGTVASGGNAKTIKKGDVFTIADLTESAPDNQFVCTEELKTAADGSGTLKFYPALPADVAGKKITCLASHTASLAFHKNAFALVTAPLVKPMGGAMAEVVNFRGMSLRVTFGYDMDKKTNIVSIDQLVGVQTLAPELAVRFTN